MAGARHQKPLLTMEHHGMADTVLTLTVEIIQLLTGEDYAVIKKSNAEVTYSSHVTPQVPNRLKRSPSPTMGQPVSSSHHKEHTDNKILELANQIIHFLTGEVWRHLVRQKDMVLMEDHGTNTSADLLETRRQNLALHEDPLPHRNVSAPSGGTNSPFSQIKSETESLEEESLPHSAISSQVDGTQSAHIKLVTVSCDEACVKEEAALSEEADSSLYSRHASSLNSHNKSDNAQQIEHNVNIGRLKTSRLLMGTHSRKVRQITESGCAPKTSNCTSLQKHQKSPKPFSCSKCCRHFITKLSLFRHERLHSGREEKVDLFPAGGLEITDIDPAGEMCTNRSLIRAEAGQELKTNTENGSLQNSNLQASPGGSIHQISPLSILEDEGDVWSGDGHELAMGPKDKASRIFKHQVRPACVSKDKSPAWTEDGQEQRTSPKNRASEDSQEQIRSSSSLGDEHSLGTGDGRELKTSPKNNTSEGSNHQVRSSCNLEGKSPVWTKDGQEVRMSPRNGCFQGSNFEIKFSCNLEDQGPVWTEDGQELKMSPKDRIIPSSTHQIRSPSSSEEDISVWSEEGQALNRTLQGFSHQIRLSCNLENQSQVWSGPKNRASQTRPSCDSDKGPIWTGDDQESRARLKNRTSQDSATQESSFSNLENESPVWTGNGQQLITSTKNRTFQGLSHETRSANHLEDKDQVWTKDGLELSSKNTPCQSSNNQTRSLNISGQSSVWTLVGQELTGNDNSEFQGSNYQKGSSEFMEVHSTLWAGDGQGLRTSSSQDSNHHASSLRNVDIKSLEWTEDGQELKTIPETITSKDLNNQTRPLNSLDGKEDGQALRADPRNAPYESCDYETLSPNDSDGLDWCKVKLLSCVECGEVFAFKSELVLHQKTHKGKYPYSCSECGKGFPSSTQLMAHHRIHAADKPFGCSLCSKRFGTKSALIVHQRVHTRGRPYTCPVCRKGFPCNSQLVIHQRTHTGEKPYSCLECGKGFISNSDLLRHRRVHTGEKPFKCPECVKCFSQKSHLREHQRTHRR